MLIIRYPFYRFKNLNQILSHLINLDDIKVTGWILNVLNSLSFKYDD